jgi:putative tricarboxylic transport membrane protein
MDFFTNLISGLSVVLQPNYLAYCFIGVFIGTLVGVLPGIGPVGTMAILLPVTFGISPTASIIMLAGIYYGAMYGGSTTSILINLPGEAASVVTTLDGYAMALQGRAGPALGMAAFCSFIAGTLGVIGLQVIALPLVSVALRFGPPEYFSLMILVFILLPYLSQRSMLKALMMATVGILVGTMGLDPVTAKPRFTFDIPELFDGVGLAPLAMGLFGISEILLNVEQTLRREVYKTDLKNLLPTIKDWVDSIGAILRGTVIGFLIGALPGPGATVASFLSYAVEKRVSKNPQKFGHGAIEGVAGPEASNNSATAGAMVPLLTMGIPGSLSAAMLLGALMIHGITPGPLLVKQHPDLFWGVIASMYVGNILLLIINLPLIGLWVRLLRVPYAILFPLILLVCLIGSYALDKSTVDMSLMLFFGVLGYLIRKFRYEAATLILAFVLTPMFETALRQSLILSNGSFSIFFLRPISSGCLILAGLLLITPVLSIFLKRGRGKAREEKR